MSVTLVCACGKRLKAAGAVPGRVGRCPACGGMLRVPMCPVEVNDRAGDSTEIPRADDRPGPGGYDLAPSADERSMTFVDTGRTKARQIKKEKTNVLDDRGIIRKPTRAEDTLAESLGYPLWGASGLALLGFLPPALWLTSLLSAGLVPTYVLGQPAVTAMGALTMIMPMASILGLVLGYLCTFFGSVLTDAAAGEVHHPRLPTWELMGSMKTLFRCLWCIAQGFLVPGFLATLYWIYCGDLDWADRMILITLLTPAAIYSQVSFAAVFLHDDILAANPVTVLRAVFAVGTDAVRIGLWTGIPAALAALAIPFLFDLPGLFAALATYLFWVAVVYGGMVVFRVLGLFCRRHARELGWFPERPRWGVRG